MNEIVNTLIEYIGLGVYKGTQLVKLNGSYSDTRRGNILGSVELLSLFCSESIDDYSPPFDK